MQALTDTVITFKFHKRRSILSPFVRLLYPQKDYIMEYMTASNETHRCLPIKQASHNFRAWSLN
jgi:hypothetical protein